MSSTISLTASAAYGYSGQFIARITGRNAKMTFEREFVGRREGNRNDTTRVDLDTPGLYEVRDVDRKGRKGDAYKIIVVQQTMADGEPRLDYWDVEKADAMKIAKELDAGRAFDSIIRTYVGDPETVAARRRVVELKKAMADTTGKSEEELVAARTELATAEQTLAALLAQGKRSADGWQFATAKEAVAKQTAQTIETATQACWAAVQALPEKEAKKVLNALKLLVSPPKAKPAADAAAETPAGAAE